MQKKRKGVSVAFLPHKHTHTEERNEIRLARAALRWNIEKKIYDEILPHVRQLIVSLVAIVSASVELMFDTSAVCAHELLQSENNTY